MKLHYRAIFLDIIAKIFLGQYFGVKIYDYDIMVDIHYYYTTALQSHHSSQLYNIITFFL